MVERVVDELSRAKNAEVFLLLEEREYEAVYFDGLNDIFLHKSKIELKEASGDRVCRDGACQAQGCSKATAAVTWGVAIEVPEK